MAAAHARSMRREPNPYALAAQRRSGPFLPIYLKLSGLALTDKTPLDIDLTVALESAPYLVALVASSCRTSPSISAALGR